MHPGDATSAAAAVLNACWWVRWHRRPQRQAIEQRRRAIAALAALAALELARAQDPEPVLYAIAAGLYDRADPRFAA